MSNVKVQTVTQVRNHIYDEMEKANITTITRSGKFSGVLITLGNVDPKVAAHLHDVIRRNPRHGVRLLINQAKASD